MQKAKNILLLLLFTIMLAPVLAPLVLQLKILLVKIEAEERLETDNLQVLHIPLQEICWSKKGREIVINNRLFDLKKFKQDDTEIIVTGVFDDEETFLEKEINGLWQEQQSRQSLILLKYFQVLSQTYFPQNIFHIREIPGIQKIYRQEVFSDYKRIFLKIPTPPPQQNDSFLVI